MGIFSRKKGVIDLSERYRKQQEKIASMKEDVGGVSQSANATSSDSGFGFFGAIASSAKENNSDSGIQTYGSSESLDSDEKRRRLAKRLADMTEKLEDISNQIYHLQQRIEVIERKMGVGSY